MARSPTVKAGDIVRITAYYPTGSSSIKTPSVGSDDDPLWGVSNDTENFVLLFESDLVRIDFPDEPADSTWTLLEYEDVYTIVPIEDVPDEVLRAVAKRKMVYDNG